MVINITNDPCQIEKKAQIFRKVFWRKRFLMTKKVTFGNFLQAPNIAKMRQIPLTIFKHFIFVSSSEHDTLWRMQEMVVGICSIPITSESCGLIISTFCDRGKIENILSIQ